MSRPQTARLQWMTNSSVIGVTDAELQSQKVPFSARDQDEWEVGSTGMNSVPEDAVLESARAEETVVMQRLRAQRSAAAAGGLRDDESQALASSPRSSGALASPKVQQALAATSSSSIGQSSRDRYDELLKQAARKEALGEAPLSSPPGRNPMSQNVRQLEERQRQPREVDIEMERLREMEERLQRYKMEEKSKDSSGFPSSAEPAPRATPKDSPPVEPPVGSALAKAEIDKWSAEAKAVAAERECDMLKEQLMAEVSKRRELEAYARSMEDLMPTWRQQQSKMEESQRDQVTSDAENSKLNRQPLPTPTSSPASSPKFSSRHPGDQAQSNSRGQWRHELEAQFEATLQDIYKVQDDLGKSDAYPKSPEKSQLSLGKALTTPSQKSFDSVEAITERLSRAEAAFVQQQLLFSQEWTNLKQQLQQMQTAQQHRAAASEKADDQTSEGTRVDDQGSSRSTPSVPRFSQSARDRSISKPGRLTSSPGPSHHSAEASHGRLIYPGGVPRVPSDIQLSPRMSSQPVMTSVSEVDMAALRRNIKDILNPLKQSMEKDNASEASSSVTVMTKDIDPGAPERQRSRSPDAPTKHRSSSVKVAGYPTAARQHSSASALSSPLGRQTSASIRVPVSGVPLDVVEQVKGDGSKTALLVEWIAKAVAGGGPEADFTLIPGGGSGLLPRGGLRSKDEQPQGPASAGRSLRRGSPSPPPKSVQAALSIGSMPHSSAASRSIHSGVAGGSMTVGPGVAGGSMTLRPGPSVAGVAGGSMNLAVGGGRVAPSIRSRAGSVTLAAAGPQAGRTTPVTQTNRLTPSTPSTMPDLGLDDSARRGLQAQIRQQSAARQVSMAQKSMQPSPRGAVMSHVQPTQPASSTPTAYRSVASSPASSVAFPMGDARQRIFASPGAAARGPRHTPSAPTPVQTTPSASWVPQHPASPVITPQAPVGSTSLKRHGSQYASVRGSF